jgi:hypothetical protein
MGAEEIRIRKVGNCIERFSRDIERRLPMGLEDS